MSFWGITVNKALLWMGPVYVCLGQSWANREGGHQSSFRESVRQLSTRVPYGLSEVRESLDELRRKHKIVPRKELYSGPVWVMFECTLPNGNKGLLKVRRKSVKERAESNSKWLKRLLRVGKTVSSRCERWDKMVDRIRARIHEEASFRDEMNNLQFLKKWTDGGKIIFPTFREEWCTDNCVVMDLEDDNEDSISVSEKEDHETLVEDHERATSRLGVYHDLVDQSKVLVWNQKIIFLDFAKLRQSTPNLTKTCCPWSRLEHAA